MTLREQFEKEHGFEYSQWLEETIAKQALERVNKLSSDMAEGNRRYLLRISSLEAELASLQNRIDEAPKETRSRVFASVNMGVLDEEVYTVALLEIKEEQVKK